MNIDFETLLSFVSQIINSSIPILAVLFSGLLASIGASFINKIIKGKEKNIETANYAKVLLYESAFKKESYEAAKTILQQIENKKLIYTSSIAKNWNNFLLEMPQEFFYKHPMAYLSLPNILSNSDTVNFKSNIQKFTHLPTDEFEFLYFYFTINRKASIKNYKNELGPNLHLIIKEAIIMINIINTVELYLKYLIEKGQYSYIYYLLPFLQSSKLYNEYLKSKEKSTKLKSMPLNEIPI